MNGTSQRTPRPAKHHKKELVPSFDILFAAVVLFLLAGLVMIIKL